MKQILLAYVVVSIVLIALLSVLSYGYGSGYVYVYWREWQLQTNIWLLLFFFLVDQCFATNFMVVVKTLF